MPDTKTTTLSKQLACVCQTEAGTGQQASAGGK